MSNAGGRIVPLKKLYDAKVTLDERESKLYYLTWAKEVQLSQAVYYDSLTHQDVPTLAETWANNHAYLSIGGDPFYSPSPGHVGEINGRDWHWRIALYDNGMFGLLDKQDETDSQRTILILTARTLQFGYPIPADIKK